MAKIYFQEMTPTGHQQLVDQVAALKKKRPTLIARLKAARALGDLSENTEYSSAKRDLRHLESRLRYLDKQLKYAKVIAPATGKQIDLGSRVTLEFLDDHEQVTYQLVGRMENDLAAGKLAFDSPLGKALRHQVAGKVVTVPAPAGNYQVKIVAVNPAPTE